MIADRVEATNKNNGCAEQNKTETDRHMRILKVALLLHVLISISIIAISTIVFYQGMIGKIEPRDMAVIFLGLFVMQLIINAIRKYVFRNRAKRVGMGLVSYAKVIVPRGEFVDLGVKAGEDLYEKGIIPTNALSKRECVYIVEIEIGEFKEAPVLILSSTYHSKTAVHELNNGMGLSNRVSYMFNIVARSGEFINFQFNSGGIVKKFVVNEYYIP
uniref:Uncharacterized protein n=1 Tax=viral metagenome TaxID=1070528 RepID=A0A6M3MB42_9ZZZZ